MQWMHKRRMERREKKKKLKHALYRKVVGPSSVSNCQVLAGETIMQISYGTHRVYYHGVWGSHSCYIEYLGKHGT